MKNEKPTFITGNPNKAKRLAMYLGVDLDQQKMDLEELQSLDLRKIVHHKLAKAYKEVQKPVLVQDTSVSFHALGGLPGPFIKFFVDNIPYQRLCDMLPRDDRRATAYITYGYFDGVDETYFEGSLDGTIADTPRGDNGWDWDVFFIPDGYEITRAEMNDEEYEDTYRAMHPFAEMKKFLE